MTTRIICLTFLSFVFLTVVACDKSSAPEKAPATKKHAKKSSGGHHPTELSEGMVNPGYEDKPKWFKLSFLDIREDLSEATKNNKRLMLYFYQDGCPYCAKLLKDNFGQRAIAEKTQATVDTIAINMWGSNEVTDLNGKTTNEKDFARSLNVNFTPTLIFLNEEGKVIMRINGYYFPEKFNALLDYIQKRMETKVSFSEYYKKVAPKTASAELNFEPGFEKPPYDLKAILAKQGKPLMVMFAQTRCRSCDEFHSDIIKRPQTKAEYQKLSVAVVDIWSNDKIVTPTGETTTVAEWAKKLKVNYTPSLVFFDAQGKEVFRTEAYFKSFHIQGAMAYVHEKAYVKQPSFQRYLAARRERLEKETGKKINLMD